jgi:hypothetical protein
MLGRAKPVLQFRRKFVALAQSAHIVSTVGPAGLDQDVLALDKTGILEGMRRASTPAPGPNRCWQTPPQASLVGVEIFVCISTPSATILKKKVGSCIAHVCFLTQSGHFTAATSNQNQCSVHTRSGALLA